MESRRVFVTGAAGFIGYHLAHRLLADGVPVLGLDDLNPYYDPALKQARLDRLLGLGRFTFERAGLGEHDRVLALIQAFRPTEVVHLAAQAGVRHSIEQPRAYVAANVDGFLGILEACRAVPVRHLVYASSSSVYGANTKVPFAEDDPVDHPASLYAATKRANELMAESYAHLFGIPASGLRLFTVYGPWGRPDMAYYRFAEALLEGREIELFNAGRMSRDFTYVDDVIEAIVRLLDRPPATPGHVIYNIGNHTPVPLTEFIAILARAIGREARTVERPMQPGDVPATFADVGRLANAVGFAPSTPLEEGIGRFVAWFRDYHGGRLATHEIASGSSVELV